MFIRARLKSAFNNAVRNELAWVGYMVSACSSLVYLGYKIDTFISHNGSEYQKTFLNQVVADPVCKPLYEIWDKRYSPYAFTCGPDVDIDPYMEKFTYFAKQIGFEMAGNWFWRDGYKQTLLPLGLCVLGFSVYGFIYADLWFERRRAVAEAKNEDALSCLSIFGNCVRKKNNVEKKDAATQTEFSAEVLPPAYEDAVGEVKHRNRM